MDWGSWGLVGTVVFGTSVALLGVLRPFAGGEIEATTKFDAQLFALVGVAVLSSVLTSLFSLRAIFRYFKFPKWSIQKGDAM